MKDFKKYIFFGLIIDQTVYQEHVYTRHLNQADNHC